MDIDVMAYELNSLQRAQVNPQEVTIIAQAARLPKAMEWFIGYLGDCIFDLRILS
jgi:hypothetical protein